jgi:8-oxo-dGTP diphosphatase
MKDSYVVGLLFNERNYDVVLINKLHPEWQKGKYNGVGGKIERKNQNHTCYDIICDVSGFDPCCCPYESPFEAMRREFCEEAGLDIETWKEFAILKDGYNFELHCFYTYMDFETFYTAVTKTDEHIKFCTQEDLDWLPLITNLRWMIPMAMSMKNEPRIEKFIIQQARIEEI